MTPADTSSKTTPSRSRPRRRRFTALHATLAGLVVLDLLLIGSIVTSTWRPTFWIWAGLGLLLGATLLTGSRILEESGRMSRLRGRGLGALAVCISLAIASIAAVLITDNSPQLGLDLQGGYSIVLTAQGDPPDENIDQAIEVIRARIDGLGVAEPEITRQGDSVVVDLPGIRDRAEAQALVGRTAKLEFRPVVVDGLPFDTEAGPGDDPCAAAAAAVDPTATTAPVDPTATTAPADPAATTAPADPAATTAPADPADPAATTEAPTPSGSEEEGAGAVPGPTVPAVADGEQAAPLPRQEDTTTTTAPEAGATTTTAPGTVGEPEADQDVVVLPTQEVEDQPRACTQMGAVGFEGDALSKSQAQLGGSTGSEWVVAIRVKGDQRDDANALFNACQARDATCPSGQMAIVLDDQVVSAPTVNEPNLASDEFVITGGGQGGFAESEAKYLALVLRYGALPVEFRPSDERQVSPTVGDDTLKAGILAGVIGLVAVALYLLVYYRALGIIVVLGLAVWSSLMYGVVTWLSVNRGLTLSLAGVVGIVVSIGTTVDSYIVHFERLKDEVRLGKSIRSSTERSFKAAFRTILTADIASLIGASLLWWLTVGAVRGFAFFLGLSVALDMFVMWTFDRPMVALFARSRFFTEHPVFGVARGLGREAPDDAPAPEPAPAEVTS